jgi:hypothetical protein
MSKVCLVGERDRGGEKGAWEGEVGGQEGKRHGGLGGGWGEGGSSRDSPMPCFLTLHAFTR